MSNPTDIQDKIIHFAKADERIKAVLLNGSRANTEVKPDNYQDYDIVFIVNDFDSFLLDRSWINHFGKPLLQQLPDEMNLGKDENEAKFSFTFLTIFEEGHRIDLSIFPLEKVNTHFKPESLTIVLLDKEHLFDHLPPASDSDYYIAKPNQQAFTEVCNEFWWCITNVAKGLKREQVIFAKDMLETVVRPMLWQIIEWNIGSEYDFKVSVGKSGKFAKKFLPKSLYETYLKTYSDADIENNWTALELMTELFKQQQENLAQTLQFKNNFTEVKNSTEYIKRIRIE